jgi:hypothetical protein
MSTPTPGSWIKKSPETSGTTDPSHPSPKPEKTTSSAPTRKGGSEKPSEKPKKPFVLQPHLTSRPLRGDEKLEGLKKELTKGSARKKPVRKKLNEGVAEGKMPRNRVKYTNKENNR